jgi:hypothetical protein
MTVACQQFHCLPHEGGLLDQDSFFIATMGWVVEEQKAKEAEDRYKEEQRQARGRK